MERVAGSCGEEAAASDRLGEETIVNRRIMLPLVVGAFSALALVGCSSDEPSSSEETTQESPDTEESPDAEESPDMEESPDEQAMTAEVATGETELGTVVVDGKGMTAYYFDNDEPGSGKSSCEGDCLTAWPPITAAEEEPVVEGVTGDVGTIEWPDGTYQVTIDDMPIYTFAQDTAAGDVKGQGVNGVWWAINPDGSKITE